MTVEELRTLDRIQSVSLVNLKGEKNSSEVQLKFWNDVRILLFANHLLPRCFSTHVHAYIYKGIFVSTSRISELDCATTKTDTAERSISICIEFLQVFFFLLGALAYFQVSPLGGSREEKFRSQWIRKRSVSWNLPKLSQLWLCNGGFGSCTTQNHIQKTNSWMVHELQQSGCLCAAKRTGRPGLWAGIIVEKCHYQITAVCSHIAGPSGRAV